VDDDQLIADADQMIEGRLPLFLRVHPDDGDGHNHAHAVMMRGDPSPRFPVAEPHGLADAGMADHRTPYV
jgi:hypothetical protein